MSCFTPHYPLPLLQFAHFPGVLYLPTMRATGRQIGMQIVRKTHPAPASVTD